MSPTEVWAAGAGGHLLHYTGPTWVDVDPPELRGLHIDNLALTTPMSRWLTSAGVAYEYTGTTWVARTAGLVGAVVRVAAPAIDNVWAVGLACPDSGCQSALLHWDGTRWTAPIIRPGAGYIYDIAMPTAGTGWAVGGDSLTFPPTSLVLRWDGTRWSDVPGPPSGGVFFGVWTNGATNAWLLGVDKAQHSQICHYTAGTWACTSTASAGQLWSIYMQDDTTGWVLCDNGILAWNGTAWTLEYPFDMDSRYAAVTGAGSAVWVVGPAARVLQREAPGTWTQQTGGPTTHTLVAVAAVDANDVWAGGTAATLLHYDGRAWTPVAIPVTTTLYQIQMRSATDGYILTGDRAAGTPSHLLHYDGGAWTLLTSSPQPLNQVSMLGPGEGWGVGAGGTILHWSGGPWIQATTPTTGTLRAVAFDRATHGWAAGGVYNDQFGDYMPQFVEYTGGVWVARGLAPGRGEVVRLVLAPGGAEGWAVTAGQSGSGALYDLSGGSWTGAFDAGGFGGLALDGDGTAWNVTATNAWHYTGGAWQLVEITTIDAIADLALVPGRGGWGGGGGGAMLHYDPRVPGQQFYDVPPGAPFYSAIADLAQHNIVSGYANGTFRPYVQTTRAQMVKIVVLGFAQPLPTPAGGQHTFADVPTTFPFFAVIETAAADQVVSGYACGGAGEPCDGEHRPYFRPYANVTRGQLSKIDAVSAGWPLLNPPNPTFTDVLPASTFYRFVETAVCHGVVSGYADHTFRPGANTTRGQISKIVYLSITSGAGCGPPTAGY